MISVIWFFVTVERKIIYNSNRNRKFTDILHRPSLYQFLLPELFLQIFALKYFSDFFFGGGEGVKGTNAPPRLLRYASQGMNNESAPHDFVAALSGESNVKIAREC